MTAAVIILALALIFGAGLGIGRAISLSNPSTEAPIVRGEATIICIAPRRYNEVA